MKFSFLPKSKNNLNLLLLVGVLVVFVAIPLTVILSQKSEEVIKNPTVNAAGRDPALWPFDKLSPWNMPIGSSASYVSTQINMSGKWQDVEGELVFLNSTAPMRTLYANYGDWWPGVACNTGMANQGQIHVEDGYIVPDPLNGGEDGTLPNRGGGGLRSDNKTIQEFQYSTRCSSTGPVTAGAFRTTYDIFGKGIPTNGSTSSPEGFGAHGGSGLSGVGGNLRKWEVADTGPIRHALKITVNVGVLSKCNNGYRWPAITADSGYNVVGNASEYFGPVCDFRMGSLTAIQPSVNCQTFVTTAFGKRICQALQDYGGYVVDTGPRTWGAMTIIGEYGTASAFNGSGADIVKMFGNLYVIANNSSTSVGGGGTPRVALAPDFGAAVDNLPTVSITNPANGALINTTSVIVTANATDDIGVSKVEFSVDGLLKTADTTSPYSYPWTTTGLSGSHTISAKAYDTTNQASVLQTVSVTVDLTAQPPPAPWVSADIGAVGLGGSAIYSSSTGTFTVSGAGDDIWNSADAFRYVYQTLNGDGSIVAKVLSQTNTDPWAKAGVMLRENTAAGSINALLTTTIGSGISLQYRSVTAGTGTYFNGGTFSYPVWLKLQRTGNNISAFTSIDGSSFTQVGSTFSLPMATSITVGLAVTAHNNTLLSQALFNNVKVSVNSGTITNLLLDQLIATRGDNLLPHDIKLPAPVNSYDWGQHGKEWAKSLYPDSHYALSYGIVYPDLSQSVSGIGAVRYNVRRIALWNYQPSTSSWVKVYDGLPDWYSALNYALTAFYPVARTIEADGSYSYPVPTGQMLHFAMGTGPTLTESGGTIALIESRLLGTPAAIAAAVVGDAAGVDYRGSVGDATGPGYHAASSGHFQRLTGSWQTNMSLSTAMTDTQVRANPPPGFSSTVTVKTGDLNGDNLVNGSDLAVLLSRWGSTDATADINKSGKVDSADLALLLAHWGT